MPDPSRHVWYHRRLLSRHISSHRRRSQPSIRYELQPVRVRTERLRTILGLIFLTISRGFLHLGCGIAVGMTGLAAGYCIGIVGDAGVRAYMEQSRIFVGMVLILIFGEVLGLYGYVTCHKTLNCYDQ